MSSTRQPQSFIPDMPRGDKIVKQDGSMDDQYRLFLDQLILGLQSNFTPNGWRLPPIDSTTIASIAALYTPYIGSPRETLLQNLPDISGQTIFDSTSRVPKVFVITYNAVSPFNVLTANWLTYVLV